jgi:cell fate regulator YaaT (PSP1 superfamily)
MRIAKVQFAPWDKVYNFSLGDLQLKVGEAVIARTELGLELGKIIDFADLSVSEEAQRELKPLLRSASATDLAQLPDDAKKAEVLEFCRTLIARHNLPMKLIDVHFSWEGNRFNFAFIADGRVDFRELVKDLAGHFNANIRLTQIGTRDETKISGDCGLCGRSLCCQICLKEFCSITSEMAEVQQVVNRGSDRISGICGRLMCCLAFEYEGYKALDGQLPPLGTKVNMDGVRGTIINHHILKQTVDVRIPASRPDERDAIIEVDPKRHQKPADPIKV